VTRTSRVVLIVSIVVSGAAPAWAQVCTGSSGFSRHAYKFYSEGGFVPDATRFEAGVSAGRDSAFGGVGIGMETSHEIPVFVVGALGRLGVEWLIGPRLAVCPSGDFAYARYGGSYLGGTSLTQWAAGSGISFGFVASETATRRIIPTASARLVTARYTGSAVGRVARDAVTFGVIQGGIGIVIHDRIGLTPGVSIPIGLPISDSAAVLGFTVGLGP
jgi:hypothetical protein